MRFKPKISLKNYFLENMKESSHSFPNSIVKHFNKKKKRTDINNGNEKKAENKINYSIFSKMSSVGFLFF